MATIEIDQDLRRTDLNDDYMSNPFWLTSAEMKAADMTANTGAGTYAQLLFSFPDAKGVDGQDLVFITGAVLVVKALFDDTPVTTIGTGTLATDAVTVGGDITIVDADYFLNTTSAAPATIGVKRPTTAEAFTIERGGVLAEATPNTFTDHNLGLMVHTVGATVPCVYADVHAATAVTVGSMRLYLRVERIQGAVQIA